MKRVLVVDDIAQNLYMLRVLLQGNGYGVEEALHGAEALDQARRSPPDLIISDLLMPVMDGYALLRRWKSDDALKHIPFVVYTATYTDPKDESLALALGADAFLIKPAEPDTFMACIQAVLARVEGGMRPAAPQFPFDEQRLLADYNEALVRKLEKRAQQLEQANRELQRSIAQSQRTAAALQESEERFRATFEQAAVGIAHVGLDGGFLRVNDKLCELTACPREELLCRTLAELTVPEHRPEAAEAHAAMLAGTQRAYAAETRWLRRGSGAFWGHLVSTLLRDPAGRPQYFIAVIADNTERKLLEEQFRQAQKIESIGQLTGGIAHDFNNLLTVIIGNAELLTERLVADEALKSVADMTRVAAYRGADLTRRLLAFARRQTLDPRPVDVNALLLGMESLLRRMLPESIEVQFVQGAGLWPALVDPSQLESAVLNLCINARDAMPSGGCLTIATDNVSIDEDPGRQPEPAPGTYVRIAVSDTGSGIQPEHLAHVFEPFFTTKPPGIGTGLGLSMVHGFVKQSRGHITVESQPSSGACLTLYLPRTVRSVEAAATAEPERADLRGSERILLVEDDELVRHYAQQQLLSLGYRVTAVADGAAGLALLQARSDIDLLFTDVVMPGGLNGRQLADAALRVRPGLKVLFCSGYTDDSVIQLGVADGRVQLLAKPYGRAELARKVRAVLSAPARADAVADAGRTGGTLLILDDDPTVATILGRAAEAIGFESVLTSAPQAFFERMEQSAPSHVAIDLSMPEFSGVQILDRLAQMGCSARVIISSGADADAMHAALDHGRSLGLRMAGALGKPFSRPVLASLLSESGPG